MSDTEIVKFALTDAQLEILEPLFAALEAGNNESDGPPGMIAGQCFDDGMVVGYLDGAGAAALMKALGKEMQIRTCAGVRP